MLCPRSTAPTCAVFLLAVFAGGCERSVSPHLVTVTDANFQQVVLQADQPVLVDFWATWCGPCQTLKPAVSAMADEFRGQVVVAQLDTDQNPQMSAQYNVSAIPLLLLFHNGRVIAKKVGVPDDGSGNVVGATRRWLKANLPST